jgi:excisionase family DNA binding protein
MSEGFLSAKELAERWKLGYSTLARWRQNGTGPAYMKFGKTIRYRREDVIEYEQRVSQLPITAATGNAKSLVESPVEEVQRLSVKDVVDGLRLNRH